MWEHLEQRAAPGRIAKDNTVLPAPTISFDLENYSYFGPLFNFDEYRMIFGVRRERTRTDG